MDDSLYDEFGNYIGPDIDDSDDSDEVSISEARRFTPSETDSDNYDGNRMEVETEHISSVVLYEDKKHYPTMEEIYGPDVEVLIQEEDTVPITEPVIAPAHKYTFDKLESEIPTTTFTHEFLAAMMTKPDLIRNIAVVGNLHHGKTSLVDLLVKSTHHLHSSSTNPDLEDKPLLYTDNRKDERQRQMTIKAKPVSLVVPSSSGKHFLLNVMDTPGHNNFSDELPPALRAADGVVLVVDAVEGPLAANCERSLRFAVREGLSILLVVNKIDRLCVELRLPPEDAYVKLQHTIQMVNQIVKTEVELRGLRPRQPLSPVNGTVLFAAASLGVLFSLQSVAEQLSSSYMANSASSADSAPRKQPSSRNNAFAAAAERRRAFLEAQQQVLGIHDSTANPTSSFDPATLAKCLWGDVWFNPVLRNFTSSRQTVKDAITEQKSKRIAAARRAADSDDEEEDVTMEEPVEVSRSFVEFVLAPVWKLVSHALSLEEEDLKFMLAEKLAIRLPKSAFEGDLKRLVKHVLSRYFSPRVLSIQGGGGMRAAAESPIACFVDACVSHLPSPLSASALRAERDFTGSSLSPMSVALREARQSPSGVTRSPSNEPLTVVHCLKFFPSVDGLEMEPMGLILSGTLRRGDKIRVLGEGFAAHAGEVEDAQVREVTKISVLQAGRYRVDVSHAGAGCWVVIGGLAGAVKKSATLVDFVSTSGASSVCALNQLAIMRPLQFLSRPVFKISMEPLRPVELPRMIEALREVERSYPQARVKVEESGEHVLFGLGELALDCMLHDVREVYGRGKLEVRVSDPTVLLQETVGDVSAVVAFADTSNQQGRLKITAQPLNADLARSLERNLLPRPDWTLPPASSLEEGEDASAWVGGREPSSARRHRWAANAELREILKEDYRVDALAASRVWAFGPDPSTAVIAPWQEVGAGGRFATGGGFTFTAGLSGPANTLVDESLHGVANRALVSALRPHIVQGFQWASREGPLIEESVREVNFRVVDAEDRMDPTALGARAGGRWVPTARRALSSSMLLAQPRLMEPLLRGQVICSADAVQRVYQVLQRRRGHVLSDSEMPGSPLMVLQIQLPALDSFGFETDVRTSTAGQAFVEAWFDSWQVVDSDPLDASVHLRPLEASSRLQLARELLLKTRRRKGLREQLSLATAVDPALLEHIVDQQRRQSSRTQPLVEGL